MRHTLILLFLSAVTTACFTRSKAPDPSTFPQTGLCKTQVRHYSKRMCDAKLKGPMARSSIRLLKRQHDGMLRSCKDATSGRQLAETYDRCLASAINAKRIKKAPFAATTGQKHYTVASRYQDQSIRTATLHRAMMVQGHTFPSGSLVGFNLDGHLEVVRLTAATTVAGYKFVAGTSASFFGTGVLRGAVLMNDQDIGPYRCRASRRDPTHIRFHPKTGKIQWDGYHLNGRYVTEKRCF